MCGAETYSRRETQSHPSHLVHNTIDSDTLEMRISVVVCVS